MTDDALSEKVTKWLTETGFPLEMRTTRKLRNSDTFDNALLQTNSSYYEAASGNVREVDIQAVLLSQSPGSSAGSRKATIWVELVIECKSTSNPWVILVDPKGEDRESIGAVSFTDARRITLYADCQANARQFAIALEATTLAGSGRRYTPGYGIVESFKSQNARDSAYAATQQVVAACRNVASSDYFYGTSDEMQLACIVPVVVTTSPLYEAFLATDSGDVSCRRVAGSAALVPDARSNPTWTFIVNEDHVDQFIADLNGFEKRSDEFLRRCDFSQYYSDK